MKNYFRGFLNGRGAGVGRRYVGHKSNRCVLKRLAVKDAMYLPKERLLHYYLAAFCLSVWNLWQMMHTKLQFSVVNFVPIANLSLSHRGCVRIRGTILYHSTNWHLRTHNYNWVFVIHTTIKSVQISKAHFNNNCLYLLFPHITFSWSILYITVLEGQYDATISLDVPAMNLEVYCTIQLDRWCQQSTTQ